MKTIPVLIITLSIALVFSSYAVAAPIFNNTTGHWYDFIYGEWNMAETNAETLGGNLVTINDATEQDWLIRNFGSDRYYWIGFTKVEGRWGWLSGETVTYENWAPGQPDNGGHGEYVAVMNYNGAGRWNDYCTNCTDIGIAEWGSSKVPEPTTLILMGTGLTALAAWKMRTGLKSE